MKATYYWDASVKAWRSVLFAPGERPRVEYWTRWNVGWNFIREEMRVWWETHARSV